MSMNSGFVQRPSWCRRVILGRHGASFSFSEPLSFFSANEAEHLTLPIIINSVCVCVNYVMTAWVCHACERRLEGSLQDSALSFHPRLRGSKSGHHSYTLGHLPDLAQWLTTIALCVSIIWELGWVGEKAPTDTIILQLSKAKPVIFSLLSHCHSLKVWIFSLATNMREGRCEGGQVLCFLACSCYPPPSAGVQASQVRPWLYLPYLSVSIAHGGFLLCRMLGGPKENGIRKTLLTNKNNVQSIFGNEEKAPHLKRLNRLQLREYFWLSVLRAMTPVWPQCEALHCTLSQ